MEELLKPRSDEHPSGENLEYDPDFTALELAAQPRAERQAGDEILAAAEPDHNDVVKKAMAVLERSHDLRAAAHLAHAKLSIEGIEGLAEVSSYARGCLEDYWDTCHPQLDADDDNDPTMRINAVVGLFLKDKDTVLAGIRLAPLTDSATFGRITLRDIQIAEGEIPAPEDGASLPDRAAVSAAFKDTKTDILTVRLAAARRLLDDAEAISRIFDSKTPGDWPNFDALFRVLRRIIGYLADAVGEPEAAPADEGAENTESDAGAVAAPVAAAAPVAINSQADVRAAIDRIIDYYRKKEPSSPLPVLLERARRLVGADFMTIVRDIAPNGLDNVMNVGGIEEAE